MRKLLLFIFLFTLFFAFGIPNDFVKIYKEHHKTFSSNPKITLDTSHPQSKSERLTAKRALFLKYQGLSLDILEGSVENAVRVSVHKLGEKDIKNLPLSLVNVTRDVEGYRFKPKRLQLKKEAEISLAYDEMKIPEGYTAKDIFIFYYDAKSNTWQKLEGSKVEENKEKVKSQKLEVKGKITQFSDFIAGIIKLPESPDTSGFTPTSISGLKAADPLSGVQSIAPPTANPEGSATTSFTIELPKGRAGMQPSISLQYSNDGGHSWVGQGWNLSLPSVNIDTRWGAPRYDAQKETESYTLGGEELLPNTHRAEWEQRTENKVFYPRREGAFSKIVRKGNHPNNYHWEVSSKSGIISYYGTTADSRVQTADSKNIAHWQLSEQRDLRGNTIHYEYEKSEGLLYPKTIYYTGHGGEKGKYSVHFITDVDLGETPRADVQVSARLGLKQVYNRLLRKIEVKYDNQMVRSYEFVYEEGEYKKTLLKEIRQYDAEGKLFYANALSYYNDVRDENGNYTPFGALEKWQVPRDEIKYTILGLNGLAGNPTLAGTSNAETKGVNYRVGVGLVGLGKYFVNTLGGHGSNSSGKSHSKVLLQDIDGDNLPDKIYLDDNGVYFRKNLSANGLLGFGERQKINLSHLGKTKSRTNSYGAGLSIEFGEHTKVGGNIGYDKQNTKSTTASYFMDFNGDGLVDFVNGGMVYYNRLVNGIPHFEISSTGTPAPVLGSGASLLSNIEPEYTREELKEKNPLHDIVRTWTAPYTGTIKVKHQYQLIEDSSQERQEYQNNDGTPRADGVMLYFQHKGNLVWKERILAEDYVLKNRTDNINIRKGDVLYFRVSSVYDGNYDTMHWLPEVEYQEIDTQERDENGLHLRIYHPERDAIYPSEHYVVFPTQVSPRLKGIFEKKATTDKVHLRIYKTHTETHQESLIAKKIYDEIAVNDDLSNLNLGGFSEDELLSIRMYSPTEIDWRSVELSPKIEYSYQGQTFVEKVGVDYEIYAKVDEHYIPTTVESWEQGQVFLTLDNAQTSPNPLKDAQNNPLNGSILLTGKTANESVSRTHYEVINGILQEKRPASEQITKEIESNTPIYFVLTASSLDLYESLKRESYRIKAKIGDVFAAQTYDNYLAYIPFKSPDVETKFGKSFRCWGSFIINGDKTGEVINESLLVDKYGDYDETHLPNVDTFDPDVERPELEASGVYFVRTRGVLDNNTQKHRYVGTDPDIFLSGRTMSSARLGENDLQEYLDVSLPILQGEASPALAMISQGKSKAISYGINASVEVSDKKDDDSSIGGGTGGSKSWGEHKVTQTMSDFNGDRFPDFIRGGLVQYTTPRGGISAQFQHIGDFNISKTESTGGSINGTYNHAIPKTSLDTDTRQVNTQGDGTKTATQDADKARSTLSMSAGIGVSSSADHSEMAYIDINGDGLADRVTSYSVAYNTGYGFLPEEPISIGSLNSGESNDVSGGPSLGFAVGKSKWSGSFSGGYNLAKSTSHIKTQFLDLTGDGLLDKITHDKEGIKVELNLGNRWGNAFILPHLSNRETGKNVSISHGGSINAAVNFPIFWGIRITAGGGGSYGTNTSRVEATFMDIDGDGHLDYVLSEDEDDLRVAKSNFRRTNMLKEVKNGAGNSWEIDYGWKAPTYANPNSAWVLKSVKLFDGHIGDGEDFSITHFEYEKPYYDRRERTFYGYEVVKQHAINPQDNSILRTSVQEFYNQDYFRKSLLKRAFVLGKENQMLSETLVNYHIANAKTGQDIQPSTLNLPETDATSVFIAPSEEIHREYEYKGEPYVGKPIKVKPIKPIPIKPNTNKTSVITEENAITWTDISQNQEPPQGWPRYPKFNEPGDVPGPPVQFGEPLTNANARAGFNFIPNGVEEKNIYYYHPDHLGSSSYITDRNGEVIQHTEYMAFGETFVDEHSVSPTRPYLFNGKELDYETGLYYYGARYYDPKVSIFLNVDPLVEKTGTPYAYTYNNPIRYIDPDGKAPELCPNCVTALGGVIGGGLIGGGIEAGVQLYNDGKITSWKAVWGSASQGAITGGAVGLTGGTSLLATAAVSSSANIVGGIVNTTIQGNQTTGKDIAVDATVGAVAGIAGNLLKNVGGSLWKVAPLQRGFVYESMLGLKGAMKTKNFPVIDAFYNGVATSIKTLDIGAKSYLKGNGVYNTLKGYIDKLANFNGASWGDDVVRSSDIKSKVLEVGIPRGATPSQRQQIQRAIEYAAEKEIKMNVRVVN